MSILKVKSPLILLALSIFAFLLGDGLIYRSGWYAKYIMPGGESIVSNYYYTVENLAGKHPKKKTILFIGGSEFEWAFNFEQFKKQLPKSFSAIMASSWGTDEEEWYYQLKYSDPQRNKFSTIVIALPDYLAEPDEDKLNSYQTAVNLGPLLKWKDWIDVILGYEGYQRRLDALTLALFPSHLYGGDLQDFLIHMPRRITDSYEFRRNPPERVYAIPDNTWKRSASWDEVAVDKFGRLTACRPPQLMKICNDIVAYLAPLDTNLANHITRNNEKYQQKWVSKMIEYYKGTNTQLVFLNMPRPIRWTRRTPLSIAMDITRLVPKEPNVTFLNSNLFSDMGTSKNLHDPWHMVPDRARPVFTPRLIKALDPILEKQSTVLAVSSGDAKHLSHTK